MKKLYTALVLTLFVLPLVAQNIPSYLPKDGLVGYWPFNGNANDESGNGNNGTVNGATLTVDRNGVANSAYSFDGVSNLITTNYLGIGGSDPRTISFWMKTNSNSIMHPLTYGGGSNVAGEAFQCTFNYGVQGVNSNTGNSAITYSTLSKINNGNWNLYTWVLQNSINTTTSNILIYQNGNLLNIKTYLFNENIPVKTLLGIALQFGGDFGKYNMFNGQLDDITIYNRALSEQEISQLYAGCSKETATSSNFNTLIYTNDAPVNLSATPTGGSFSGNGVANNSFNPSKAKLGKNQVKYNFKNTTGCADSTDFTMLVVDTVGATCTKFDTLKVTKFDTITVTNNVTKYDTVKVTKYDTVKVTKFDTITVKNNIYDTVKVTKYDTLTITNNVTKYDTVIVNKTNYDTVSILKIKFKLTTGIHANQLSSLSIYPNPTSDVLHIEVPDAKALEGYRYRIVDALGKEVYNQLVTQSTTEIPLKTLGAAGIYQFEILDANKTSIQSNKIVLQ